MMIVEEILLAARPAPEAILTPGELERTHSDVVSTKGEPVTSSTIVSADLLLRVVVYDEEMGFWPYPPEGASGFTARLRIKLQDFIAEVDSAGDSFADSVPLKVRQRARSRECRTSSAGQHGQ
ncbi:hypothetical protein SAMN04489740_1068 [Arthrobacter alpinus]|uniref:Uncharacterized protein n=1 Tax=Arthrobacter alpinus TaxID=656366 RepID=A0A1H5HNQ5_9MICC|nr:hypothetical protein [Arthrobacter alpinus]SEE29619.1 hypothetical protein SAMN04489740_1068 [Arthrobacter alpinus]